MNMRKFFTVVGLAALSLSFAACSDITNGLGLNGVTGSYQLQTFNGFRLPALFYQDNFEQDQLMDEVFTIYSDGSYTDDYTMRVSDRNGTSDTQHRDVGTFTQNNTALQFRDSSTGDIFTGSLSGNTLTVSQQGDTYVFQR
jgi:hypothetical protein